MTPSRKGDPMVRAQGRTKPDRNWYPDDFDWYLKWASIDSDIDLSPCDLRVSTTECMI